MARRRGRRARIGGPSLEALAGALLAYAPATLFMEGMFATQPHPTHWVGDAIGIAGGYGIGALVAAYREGRFPFDSRRETTVRHRGGGSGRSRERFSEKREAPDASASRGRDR